MELGQREILFRAWHDDWKMSKVFGIGDFTRWPPEDPESDDNDRIDTSYVAASIIMQYTGLTDCTTWEELTEEERMNWTRSGKLPSEWKGKRLFEGDIALRNNDCSGLSLVVIKYDARKGFDLPSSDHYSDGRVSFDVAIKYRKVGNIFENPQIIKLPLTVLQSHPDDPDPIWRTKSISEIIRDINALL
jgi:hypothetical protein